MHSSVWQLQEAKSKFSQLVEQALKDGPQTVTRHGTETVIVASVRDYQRHENSNRSLKSFFRKPPFFDDEIDLTRKKDTPRKEEL